MASLLVLLLLSCNDFVEVGQSQIVDSTRLNADRKLLLVDETGDRSPLSENKSQPTVLFASDPGGQLQASLVVSGAGGGVTVEIFVLTEMGEEEPIKSEKLLQPRWDFSSELAQEKQEKRFRFRFEGSQADFFLTFTRIPALTARTDGEIYRGSGDYLTLLAKDESLQLIPEGGRDAGELEWVAMDRDAESSTGSVQFNSGEISSARSLLADGQYDTLYRLRANLATDALGHGLNRPRSYFLRIISGGAPLQFTVGEEPRELTRVGLYPTGSWPEADFFPTSEDPANERILLGEEIHLSVGALPSTLTSENPLDEPVPVEEIANFTQEDLTLKIRQRGLPFDVAGRNGSWFLPDQLVYARDDDILLLSSQLEALMAGTERFAYVFQSINAEFPPSRVIFEGSAGISTAEKKGPQDQSIKGPLARPRKGGPFDAEPASLGARAVGDGKPDNYYVVPYGGKEIGIKWMKDINDEIQDEGFEVRPLTFELNSEYLVDGSWLPGEPVAFRKDVSPSVLWLASFPATDEQKRTGVLYRVWPLVKVRELGLSYRRNLPFYFRLYPRLYPGTKSRVKEEKYPKDQLFVSLEAKFDGEDPSADFFSGDLPSDFFTFEEEDGKVADYYRLAPGSSLTFTLPKDDDKWQGKEHRRKVVQWTLSAKWRQGQKFALKGLNELGEGDDDAIRWDITEAKVSSSDREVRVTPVVQDGTACALLNATVMLEGNDSTSSEFRLCVQPQGGP